MSFSTRNLHSTCIYIIIYMYIYMYIYILCYHYSYSLIPLPLFMSRGFASSTWTTQASFSAKPKHATDPRHRPLRSFRLGILTQCCHTDLTKQPYLLAYPSSMSNFTGHLLQVSFDHWVPRNRIVSNLVDPIHLAINGGNMFDHFCMFGQTMTNPHIILLVTFSPQTKISKKTYL